VDKLASEAKTFEKLSFGKGGREPGIKNNNDAGSKRPGQEVR